MNTDGFQADAIIPSLPSVAGGEGQGEEAWLFPRSQNPLSSILSPLLRHGARKKASKVPAGMRVKLTEIIAEIEMSFHANYANFRESIYQFVLIRGIRVKAVCLDLCSSVFIRG